MKKIRPSHTSDITQFLVLPPPTEATCTDSPDISLNSTEKQNLYLKRPRQHFERQTVIPSYLRQTKNLVTI